MERSLWFNRDGQPIDVRAANFLMARGEDYKRVAHEEVGPYTISTVWLGLDHSMFDDGLPLIFETMVFTTADRRIAEGVAATERYPTEIAALAGHDRVVTAVRENADQPTTKE